MNKKIPKLVEPKTTRERYFGSRNRRRGSSRQLVQDRPLGLVRWCISATSWFTLNYCWWIKRKFRDCQRVKETKRGHRGRFSCSKGKGGPIQWHENRSWRIKASINCSRRYRLYRPESIGCCQHRWSIGSRWYWCCPSYFRWSWWALYWTEITI